MAKRRRSYNKEFDYWGCAAIEAQYDDGFDSFEEISQAFKGREEIPLKRTHDDVRTVGSIKYWDLDKTNKKVYVGINKEDVDEDVKLADINKVSIEYETKDNKIIGVDHICVGNAFKPKCPKEVCNITKQRSEKPETETDKVDEPESEEDSAPEEQEGSEEQEVEDDISTKILKEEIEALKKTIEELSKAKEKPESKPDADEDKGEENTKIKLGVPDKKRHELPGEEKSAKLGFTPWGGILNKKNKKG